MDKDMSSIVIFMIGWDHQLYTLFATHPDPVFAALDAIAAEYEVDFASSDALFQDWLVAGDRFSSFRSPPR